MVNVSDSRERSNRKGTEDPCPPSLTSTFYLLPSTFYLLPSTFLLLPRRGRLLRRSGLRHFEALAVFAREQFVRLLVPTLDRFGLAVELDLVADAVGDVREVRQRGGQVSFQDVAGQDLGIVRADRVDEVAVVAAFDRRQPDGLGVRVLRP